MVHHDYHLHHYFKNREITELYFSVALRAIANSMISIYIPIYFWQLGFSIRKIMFYYLVFYFFLSVIIPFCFKAIGKWGIKHNLIAGSLISVLYFYLLNLVKDGFPYWIVAFIGALYATYYWSGFHMDFARFSEKAKTGKELGLIRFLTSFFSLLGPLLGAIIITNYNFTVLIFIVGFFVLLSVLPMLISEDRYAPYKFKFKDLLKEENTKYITSFEAAGIIGVVSGVAWPLFIFIVLKTYISLGAIVTITQVLVAFLVLYIGKLSDSSKMRQILTTGSSLHSIFWIIRYFISSGLSIFFVNLASSISFSMFDLPFNKLIYHKAIAKRNRIEFFIMREWSMAIGRFIVLFFIFFTENLFAGFVLAAFASLLFLMFRKK